MEVTVNGRVLQKRNTTAYWNAARGFVPLRGEIIVYTDRYNTGTEQEPRYVPGVKIGDGDAYVQDLPFVDEYVRNEILSHIGDTDLHVQPGERAFWNNKLNVDDNSAVVDGTLILNRN